MAEMEALQMNIEDSLSKYSSHGEPKPDPIPIPTLQLPTYEPLRRRSSSPITLSIDGSLPLHVHLKIMNAYPIIFAFARGDGNSKYFYKHFLKFS